MPEATGIAETELLKNKLTIKNEGGVIEVSNPHVDLSSEGEPFRLELTLDKIPTQIEEGAIIKAITIDRESPKLQEMLRQAQELTDIPEREKPRKILEILSSNVQYAYNDTLAELAETDPDLAQRVTNNIEDTYVRPTPLTLSEIVDSGYGVCHDLAVAMLVLGKEAGMEGSLQVYPGIRTDEAKYALKNVIRKDNGKPLFKGNNPGEIVHPGHVWVEFRTSDGEWIPVDPSPQLVGDTKEGMETFYDANYLSGTNHSLSIEGFPGHVDVMNRKDNWFLPGEARHTSLQEINSRNWKGQSTSYKGPLNFAISSHTATEGTGGVDGMTVAIVDAKVA